MAKGRCAQNWRARPPARRPAHQLLACACACICVYSARLPLRSLLSGLSGLAALCGKSEPPELWSCCPVIRARGTALYHAPLPSPACLVTHSCSLALPPPSQTGSCASGAMPSSACVTCDACVHVCKLCVCCASPAPARGTLRRGGAHRRPRIGGRMLRDFSEARVSSLLSRLVEWSG